jgi:hypothetical protein
MLAAELYQKPPGEPDPGKAPAADPTVWIPTHGAAGR